MASTLDTFVGIRAIKIAKVDALSTNNSVQLENANVLRIKFDDLGIQQFNILSIAEYPTYYLYYVEPTNFGTYTNTFSNPTDSSSGGVGGSGFVSGSDGIMLIQAYASPSGQPTGYIRNSTFTDYSIWSYNAGTGVFSVGAQQNTFGVTVQFTGSIWSNSSSTGYLYMFVSGSGLNATGTIIQVPANSSGSSNAKTISGSVSFTYTGNSSTSWGIRFSNYYGSNTFYMPTGSMNFSFESYISSSTDTNGVTTVLEPYTAVNVSNSDYNVLIDNALLARPNDFYMDVDYSSNAITAVNEEAILLGDATRADVQHSNYTTARVINPRYYGSKNISPDFNVGYNNLLPVVESDGIWFAYFDWVGGTTPEVINKAGFHVKYLIDRNGTVLTPNLSGSYYYNLLNSFNENNNKVNILFQVGETSGSVTPLQGVHPVIKSGALYQAVLFSQTGSVAGIGVNPIIFNSLIAPTNYISSATINSGSYLDPSELALADLTTPASSGSTATTTNFSGLTGNYTALTVTTPGTQVIPRATVTYNILNVAAPSAPNIFTLYIQKSTDGGNNWNTLISESYNSSHNTTYTKTLSAPADNAISGSRYRAAFSFSSTNGFPFATLSTGSFSIAQTPSVTSTVVSPYWTTGSSSLNVLTGSQFTSELYGVVTQQPVTGAGYDSPYQQFSIQVGDEIRFSADESQKYQIINVNPPTQNANNTLYLTLDRNVESGSLINSFLIRRPVQNPNFVIVDALKDSTVGGGPGFLLPEYASQDLLNNFDTIIADLTEKNLI